MTSRTSDVQPVRPDTAHETIPNVVSIGVPKYLIYRPVERREPESLQ
jgi:hypothetical protein